MDGLALTTAEPQTFYQGLAAGGNGDLNGFFLIILPVFLLKIR